MWAFSLLVGSLFIFLHPARGVGHDPAGSHVHWRVAKSELVGVIKITRIHSGKPTLLEAELHRLFKGTYNSDDDNNTHRIYVNMRSSIHPKWAEPGAVGLAANGYAVDSMHFVFLKRDTLKLFEGQRVMTPVSHAGEAMLPIRDNLIHAIPSAIEFRSTYDFLATIERLAEVDKLKDRIQKVSALRRLKDAPLTEENSHLGDAVRDWLRELDPKSLDQ